MEIRDSGHSYRLEEIHKIISIIESEVKKRKDLSDKYSKRVTIIDNVDFVCNTLKIILGAGGITLLSTIAAIPVVIGMEVGAVSLGIVNIVVNKVSKNLSHKIKKHEQIQTLGESKLSVLEDCISKALNDNVITDKEFSDILNEYRDFLKRKKEIRQKRKEQMDEIDGDIESEISNLMSEIHNKAHVEEHTLRNIR